VRGLFGLGRNIISAMSEGECDRVTVELTAAEAELIVAAVRRYQPTWPTGLDARGRMDHLTRTRLDVEHVVELLDVTSRVS
jgi:hypothetical protein